MYAPVMMMVLFAFAFASASAAWKPIPWFGNTGHDLSSANQSKPRACEKTTKWCDTWFDLINLPEHMLHKVYTFLTPVPPVITTTFPFDTAAISPGVSSIQSVSRNSYRVSCYCRETSIAFHVPAVPYVQSIAPLRETTTKRGKWWLWQDRKVYYETTTKRGKRWPSSLVLGANSRANGRVTGIPLINHFNHHRRGWIAALLDESERPAGLSSPTHIVLLTFHLVLSSPSPHPGCLLLQSRLVEIYERRGGEEGFTWPHFRWRCSISMSVR